MTMANKNTTESKISIKVTVDKVKKRVVYALADYTFVDILFSFMTLPLETIVRLLEKLEDDNTFEAPGSLNNLYQSLVDFPECYFATKECKDLLLNPRSVAYEKYLKLKIHDTEPMMKCFTCVDCIFSGRNVSGGRGVFVSDSTTFIVTDDFSVIPYTAEDRFRLLSVFGITDLSHLVERTFNMDFKQILYLVKMALLVDSPFTHFVFHSNPLKIHSDGYGFNQRHKKASKPSKMLVDVYLQKSTGKLLFVETKADFVDFAFGFLSISMGTLIGTLMNGVSSITCMDNLFRSISNMSVGRCLKTQSIKNILVKPHFGQEYASMNQVFPLEGNNFTRLVRCRRKDPRVKESFLQKPGPFIVTDDLVITPLSPYVLIDTMSKLKFRSNDVEKCEVSIGLEEVVGMLKASLVCRSTMTNSLQHLLKK